MEFLLNYLAFENKNKMVDQLPWQQWITDSQQYKSVNLQLEHFFLKIVIIFCLPSSETNLHRSYFKIYLRSTDL